MTTYTTDKESIMKLDGIDHYALNVRNMERSLEFYHQLLGFPIIKESQTLKGLLHTEVDAGNVAIALFEMPDLDLTAAHKTMTDDGFLHFAFGSTYDRFDETVQALKEGGVEIDGDPRDRGDNVSIYFADPDGHQLEINFKK